MGRSIFWGHERRPKFGPLLRQAGRNRRVARERDTCTMYWYYRLVMPLDYSLNLESPFHLSPTHTLALMTEQEGVDVLWF
jgi:hypothetical protein